MLLKRLMHRREMRFARLNDNRIVRPFAWGREFADLRFADDSIVSPNEFFKTYSKNAIERSDEFFALSANLDFQFSDNSLSWQSQITTAWTENNTVRARFFPAENARRAVVVLPHWNAPKGSYESLCRVFNRIGIAALRLTLPYHEERMPPDLKRADFLVAPNIGQTLQSMRQAVLDTRAAVRWLKKQGFERIGIVGTSIGSATAFLAIVHEPEVGAAVFNHVSGYFSDVVWRGVSTYHVRESLEKAVSLRDLREFWLPISPMAYAEKLKLLPARPFRFIYTLYDLTFPIDLSREMMLELRRRGIAHDETILPCGHYTLGEKPWIYLDGWKIVNFLRRNL
jgi:pimeloyl-ACP methyl ester carboxylesterase